MSSDDKMIRRNDMKRIQKELEAYDQAHDQVINHARTATRLSDWAIIQVHRKDWRTAKLNLEQASDALKKMREAARGYPALIHSGSALIALQEFVEAKALLKLASEGQLPFLRELNVNTTAYLLGLLDAIGEMRRMALDQIREGKSREAEKTVAIMENLYEDLLSIDHTSILPTFRRKMDVARRLIESTRGDVVTDLRRISLEEAIKNLEKQLR
jgi:translin